MITQEQVKHLFDYCPESGDLIWKSPNKSEFVGKKAGWNTISGVRLEFSKKTHVAHALIFIYMTGEKPSHIRHKDGDKLNNKWENLVDASVSVEITQELIRDHFLYTPETGEFCRVKAEYGFPKEMLNKPIATQAQDGYINCSFNGKRYPIHRLIFMWMEGYWPKYVDHKNHVKHDNRWDNLREATHSQNGQNQLRKPGKNGYKGVAHKAGRKKAFEARVYKDGRCYTGGTYYTAKEAAIAYNEKATELFGEFACLNDI